MDELNWSCVFFLQFRPSPIALEPCVDQKAAVLSLLIRLPNGSLPYTPPGQSGTNSLYLILFLLIFIFPIFEQLFTFCLLFWILIVYLGLAIASTLVSLGSYSSRKNNISESREMPRSLPKAKTPPTLSQLAWNSDFILLILYLFFAKKKKQFFISVLNRFFY